MEAATLDHTEAFETDLQFALEIATGAPSSHNVQPWSLAQAEADAPGVIAKLVLALDPERCLRALPQAHELEMHLSCGAYLEALVTGLVARGWQAEVSVAEAAREVLPDPLQPLATVRVTGRVEKAAREEAERRCGLAMQRKTHRGPYQGGAIPRGVAEAVSGPRSFAFPALSQEPPGVAGWQLIESPEAIQKAADFVSRHASIEFTHAGNWAETYRCLRFDDSQASGDGMPITSLLGPLPSWQRPLLRALLAPAAMRGLGRLGLARSLAGQFGDRVSEASALLYGFMPSDGADPGTRLAAGAQMFAVWLALTEQGLSLHPISVVLQHERLRVAFQRELGLPPGRGFFFARVGYANDRVEPTPRRCPDVRTLIRI